MQPITLEEPRKLIKQLVSKFDPTNDIKILSSINDAVAEIITQRQHQLLESRKNLQGSDSF